MVRNNGSIVVSAQTDAEGRLTVRIPDFPDQQVTVVVTPADHEDPWLGMTPEQWRDKVRAVAGICADAPLERPEQPPLETRNPLL